MSTIPANPEGIDAASEMLRQGGLVAFATETVYGLGADATNDRAVARIFEAKGRPSFNPLIVHAPSAEAHRNWAVFNDQAEALAEQYWPGALTLVLPRHPNAAVSLLVSAGLETIAVRVPDHPVAQALFRQAGCPVAAPSANRSGLLSPTAAAHVHASLGNAVDLILDGGDCHGGLESTVVSLTGPEPLLLRPGLITREALEAVVGPVFDPPKDSPVAAPGMLASHYAPHAPVRLNARSSKDPEEVLLTFGDAPAEGFATVRQLSARGDLVEAAANLFRLLHELDALSPGGIAVSPIPGTGLGAAINDRLARAAAPA